MPGTMHATSETFDGQKIPDLLVSAGYTTQLTIYRSAEGERRAHLEAWKPVPIDEAAKDGMAGAAWNPAEQMRLETGDRIFRLDDGKCVAAKAELLEAIGFRAD